MTHYIDYKICTGASIIAIQREVNSALSSGYEPIGTLCVIEAPSPANPSVKALFYHQAMGLVKK